VSLVLRHKLTFAPIHLDPPGPVIWPKASQAVRAPAQSLGEDRTSSPHSLLGSHDVEAPPPAGPSALRGPRRRGRPAVQGSAALAEEVEAAALRARLFARNGKGPGKRSRSVGLAFSEFGRQVRWAQLVPAPVAATPQVSFRITSEVDGPNFAQLRPDGSILTK